MNMSGNKGTTMAIILAVAIIIASFVLSSAIRNVGENVRNGIITGLSQIGYSDSTTSEPQVFNEYMAGYEASTFLQIHIDDFNIFAQSGELDGTFTIIQDNRVFSKEKLTQWLTERFK